MDIKLLAPVVPEAIPAEELAAGAVAAAEAAQSARRRAWLLEQRRQSEAGAAAAGIAAGERAYHAKIAGWEDELLGMLQAQARGARPRAVPGPHGLRAAPSHAAGPRAPPPACGRGARPAARAQMAPISIRAVVQAFKDRIHTERDKAEFKALCDRHTVVRRRGGCGARRCVHGRARRRSLRPRMQHPLATSPGRGVPNWLRQQVPRAQGVARAACRRRGDVMPRGAPGAARQQPAAPLRFALPSLRQRLESDSWLPLEMRPTRLACAAPLARAHAGPCPHAQRVRSKRSACNSARRALP